MRSWEVAMRFITLAILGLATAAAAQNASPQNEQASLEVNQSAPQVQAPPAPSPQFITVPAGTKVLLVLKNSVSSKNAKKGDGVYLESSFPITIDGKVVIPAGTF